MGKRILMAIITCSLLLFTGCGNSMFKKAVDQGRLAVASQEYEKAKASFVLALDEKEDKEVRNMLGQIEDMLVGLQAKEDNEVETALEYFEKVVNREDVFPIIVEEARQEKKELHKIKVAQAEAQEKEEALDTLKAYDEKIKTLQQLPNTYVVANHITDFNNDDLPDLLVSTWIMSGNRTTDEHINNAIYTYKDGTLIQLNNKFTTDLSGHHSSNGLFIMSSKDGEQILLNVRAYSANGGTEYEYEDFYTWNNNQWEKYLSRDFFSDAGELGEIGDINNYYNAAGGKISENDYNLSLQKYVIETELYGTEGSNAFPIINAYVDQYNPEGYIEFKASDSEGGAMLYGLDYINRPNPDSN